MTVSYSWRPFLRRRRKSGGRDQYLHLQVGEVTLIFTTSDNSKLFAGEPATGYGALPLSYARHLRTATAAGFEPATSRLTVEVTHVFTTGNN
jgi:hypothetical protein